MVNKILLVIVVAVVLIVGFLGISHIFTNNDRDTEDVGNSSFNEMELGQDQQYQQYQQQPNQSNMERGIYENTKDCKNPIFTEYFVDPQKVQKVGQVGVVHGSGLYIVERSYVSIKSEFNEQKVPVYAPVDMTLRAGSHYQDPGSSKTALPDYALWFDLECGVEINLAHLKEVVESIAAQLPNVNADSRSTQLEPIKFKAGDLVGYFIYKEGGVSGFDFIVRDRKVVNQFINQERYSDGRAENLINGVCPYDYYESQKKEEYYNLLGGGGGTIFKIKDCGNSSRDVAGTISGMWFLDKEPQKWIYDSYKDGDYGSTLSIVGDEERITIGNLGQNKMSWTYPDNPTYKLPEQVTGEHCYQFNGFTPGDSAGWAYFKLVSDMELDVVFSPEGTCPSALPSGAKRYYK